jgi:methyl-accepting chemotaxis protein
MKNLTDNMNQILGIEGDLITEDDNKRPLVIPSKSKDQDKDIQNDYEYARSNLYGVIETGSDALNQLVELAKASEHPRAFEVVAQLTKTLVDANKDLLDIQKKVKDLRKEQQDQPENNVTNNNLFVGSTSDLLKMIKDGSD